MYSDELMHFGVKGMKWGVRRHRKAYERISRDADNLRKNGYKEEAKAVQKVANKQKAKADALQSKYDSKKSEKQENAKSEKKGLSSKQKTAVKVGASAAGTALAVYGSYKASKYLKSQAGKKVLDKGFDYYRKNHKLWEEEASLFAKVSGSTIESIKYLYQNK